MVHLLRWAVLSAVVAGCGDARPTLVPVSGRITMNDAPVKEVIVNFAPTGSTAGSGSLGATTEDGQFELTDVRGQKGAHPGDYRIHLYPAPHAKSSAAPTDVVSTGGGGGIPSIYIDPNNSPLVAKVPTTGGHVEVILTADGQNSRTTISPLSD